MFKDLLRWSRNTIEQASLMIIFGESGPRVEYMGLIEDINQPCFVPNFVKSHLPQLLQKERSTAFPVFVSVS